MIFQGKYYWKTIGFELQAGYPRLISDGFPGLDQRRFFTGRLSAAFLYSGDNHTYFIKDAMLWRLNFNREFTSAIENDYPQFVSRWLHIGEKITSALQWINGYTYFFSDQLYYRYDHQNHRVKPPFSLSSFIVLCLNRSMTVIRSIPVQSPNGGFNVQIRIILNILVYRVGNVD